MAKKTTKSSAAKESVNSERQQDDAATVPPVTVAASGPAGSQMPAGDNTPGESGGDAAGAVTAAPVKPQTAQEPDEAMVAEAASPAPATPEVEASASGTESPSQGDAAEGTGANAGPAISLFDVLAEAGAEDVGELLYFAGLGKRLADQFSTLGADPDVWLSGHESGAYVGVDWGKPGSDVTALGVLSPDEGYRPFGGMRVKSKRDGWRRAGIVHAKAGREFAADELTPEQVRLIMSDPNLTVELL